MNRNFNDIFTGDSFSPEPAGRYRAVNELLRDFGATGTPGFRRGRNECSLRITVYNSGTDEIPRGAAAGFDEAGTGLETASGDLVPAVKLLTQSTDMWGVAAAGIPPWETEEIILSGVAAVRLSAALPAGTKFVEPGDGGSFKAASGGRAQVIASQGNTALVLLGGAGAGAAETVICRVDGGNAESGFNVTLYGNGKDQPKTGTGVLFVPELALGSTIPAGSWILGHRSVMQITGGGEE